ncbi:twin arginine targeting protein translocase subunit TatC [Chamaesiphon minutus PCC 6605]|uniref:Sec-independent protein translocase protein TatC n=2 Tax=Chamaesiphon TaxID=217161 RepID=K9UMD7_CHAP6|nr:twin arginine targeting protein translocase subunit TatC [Chamaesiphon minutus PCC 6605]
MKYFDSKHLTTLSSIIEKNVLKISSAMTPEVDTDLQSTGELSTAIWSPDPDLNEELDELDELSAELEMSFFDHLEELRLRIFYSILAVAIGAMGCFVYAKQIVQVLEIPAVGIKFLQLAPGEYFFVSVKVAGYCGLLVASPVILYQIIRFVLPGLTRRERQLVLPVVIGSSVLFVGGIAFAYYALIPAALNFLIGYGENVVEQAWSIDRYFEFVLVLLFATGLLFELPVVQILLSLLGILSSAVMLSGWKSVVVGSMVVGAIVTPSTDPLTQSLLAGAVLALYFGGIGVVKLLGK